MREVLIALIAASAPIIVVIINTIHDARRQTKLLYEKRQERFFELKIKAINEIMESMLPSFINCVEPESPKSLLDSLNELKTEIQNTMFKNSVWLVPDAYEAINRFLYVVIECGDLWHAQVCHTDLEKFAKVKYDGVHSDFGTFNEPANEIIDKLLDERAVLFIRLYEIFNSRK